jgi:hypothetical protein
MDEIETFGFIPNGGRIYCITSPHIPHSVHSHRTHLDLNRSQPPLFIWVRLSCD